MKDLTTLRNDSKITMQVLADKSGITVQSVNNIENGHVSNPQGEVRRNIEMVLGTRVNWMKTLGFEKGDTETWEDCESSLRRTFNLAYNLPEKERTQFIRVYEAYVNTFEQTIQDEDINNNPDLLLPTTLPFYRK